MGETTRECLVAACCLLLFCLMATPSIENDTTLRRYPWYGKVDISFEVVVNPAAQDAALPFVVAESDGFRKE